jgi:hypothetical protein
MGLRHTITKLLTGQSLEWHLPHTLKPGEALARCTRCSGVFVIAKAEQRVPYYCWSCK